MKNINILNIIFYSVYNFARELLYRYQIIANKLSEKKIFLKDDIKFAF